MKTIKNEEIMKLHPGFGIQIDKCSFEQITQNLREHDLVLIRGYDFNQTQFKDFITEFGPLVANFYSFSQGSAMEMVANELPNKGEKEVGVIRNKKGYLPLGGHMYINSGIGTWHYDEVSKNIPGLYYGAIYGAKTLEVGANTDFISMRLAFNRLSDGMKQTLRGLEVINQNRPLRTWTTKAYNNHKVKFNVEMDCEEVNCGPIVKKDQMGREFLSFNPRSWVRFAGWSEEESTPIFDFLTRHCTIPEHTIRHNYQDGDVVLWCQNTTVHYGVANYDIGYDDREVWHLMFKLKGDSNDNI